MRSLAFAVCCLAFFVLNSHTHCAELRVGAAKVDISPTQLPVLVNGSMRSRTANKVTTKIHARAIAIEGVSERLAICVVDSCILPRELLDEAKALAASKVDVAQDRILVSATHTHTAPSSIGALGTNADSSYVPYLRQRIADAIVAAVKDLRPAKVGWGSRNAPEFTALRRWVRRPDRLALDPFGNPTVRATMHAARNPDDAIGPTGPEDPELALISFQQLDGTPIAVLSNFSMHYFGGEEAISADYFGYYCARFEDFLASQSSELDSDDIVCVMSHGCSGDIWRRDYMKPSKLRNASIQEYSLGLVDVAKAAYDKIAYKDDADVAMLQEELPLNYRVPNKQRLEWAKKVVAEMGDRLPETQPEIYAREQIYLDQLQNTKVLVQAIKIGDIAIATTPNETYALSGLKLKLQSPFEHTLVIELANGGEGYIPPPEQHLLGGYNTWAARSAGLEVTAEPKIVATCLSMLETISGQPRRENNAPLTDAAKAILRQEPSAYWQLHELQGPTARDSSRNGNKAIYEPGVLFFLDGPNKEQNLSSTPQNRCAHFAGGRLIAWNKDDDDQFSVRLSFWNGMPLGSRDVLGWMLSIDHPGTTTRSGIHLGLSKNGKLTLLTGNEPPIIGSTVVDRWKWSTATVVFKKSEIEVYLNDSQAAEITVPWQRSFPIETFFFGGRSDNDDNWEGKLDDIAIFPSPLTANEIRKLAESTK